MPLSCPSFGTARPDVHPLSCPSFGTLSLYQWGAERRRPPSGQPERQPPSRRRLAAHRHRHLVSPPRRPTRHGPARRGPDQSVSLVRLGAAPGRPTSTCSRLPRVPKKNGRHERASELAHPGASQTAGRSPRVTAASVFAPITSSNYGGGRLTQTASDLGSPSHPFRQSYFMTGRPGDA